MKIGIIVSFIGMSVLFFFNCRNAACGMIKKTNINSRHYNKRFLKTPKWAKKMFNITQQFIPKWLFFELILSVIFLAICPINIIIYMIFYDNTIITGWQFMVPMLMTIFNMFYFSIMSYIFKKH